MKYFFVLLLAALVLAEDQTSGRKAKRYSAHRSDHGYNHGVHLYGPNDHYYHLDIGSNHGNDGQLEHFQGNANLFSTVNGPYGSTSGSYNILTPGPAINSQHDHHPTSRIIGTKVHSHTHTEHTITNAIGIPVPKPYPVTVLKKIHVPVPRPYPVHITKKVPVPVEVRVPVEVPKPYPVHVTQKVPVRVPVYVRVPQYVRVEVSVPKPYPVHVDKPVPVPVHVPVYVKVPVPVNNGPHVDHIDIHHTGNGGSGSVYVTGHSEGGNSVAGAIVAGHTSGGLSGSFGNSGNAESVSNSIGYSTASSGFVPSSGSGLARGHHDAHVDFHGSY